MSNNTKSYITSTNLEEYFKETFNRVDEHDLKMIETIQKLLNTLKLRLDREVFQITINTYLSRTFDTRNIKEIRNIKIEFNQKIKNKIPKSVKNHIFDELCKVFNTDISQEIFDCNHRNKHSTNRYQITFDYEVKSELN